MHWKICISWYCCWCCRFLFLFSFPISLSFPYHFELKQAQHYLYHFCLGCIYGVGCENVCVRFLPQQHTQHLSEYICRYLSWIMQKEKRGLKICVKIMRQCGIWTWRTCEEILQWKSIKLSVVDDTYWMPILIDFCDFSSCGH